MATIPTATGAGLGQVRAQGAGQLPNVSQQVSTNADVFGGAQAKLLARASDALGQAGQAAFQIEAQDAALQAADIEMQAKKEAMSFFYDPDNGLLNSRGADALGAGKAFQNKMADIRKKYGAMATHPLAQQALAKTFDALDLSGQETALRHESSERRAYASDLVTANIALSSENASLNFNDPDKFTAELENVVKLSHQQAVLLGFSQNDAGYKKLMQDNVSGLYTNRALAMINSGDPKLITQAYKDYEENRSNYNLKDTDKLDGLFDAEIPKIEAEAAYTQFTSENSLDKMSFDNVIKRGLAGRESNFSQFDEYGKPLTSPKGAVGYMQVMEDTGPEAAKLAGLPWDRDKWLNDKEYNIKIGTAYANDLKDKFGSNVLALMAYNSGKGAVWDFMNGTNKTGKNPNNKKLGDPRKGDLSMADFVARYPYKETRDYVKNIAERMGGKIDENAALDYASKLPAASQPFFMAQVEQRNSALEKAQKEYKTSVTEQLQQALEQNNGDPNGLNADLIAAAKSLGIFEKSLEGAGTTDKEFVLDLEAMDTQDLLNFDFDDPETQMLLSYTDRMAWKKKQVELGKPENANMEKAVETQAKHWFSAYNNGADPEDKNNKAAYNDFKQSLSEEVAIQYRANGNKPVTPEQIASMAKAKMTGIIQEKGFFGTYDKRIKDLTLEDIPEDTRSELEMRLLGEGLEPTNTRIIALYAKLKQPKAGVVQGEAKQPEKGGGNPFGMMSGLGLSFKSDAPKKDLSINKTKDFPSIDSYGAQGR